MLWMRHVAMQTQEDELIESPEIRCQPKSGDGGDGTGEAETVVLSRKQVLLHTSFFLLLEPSNPTTQKAVSVLVPYVPSSVADYRTERYSTEVLLYKVASSGADATTINTLNTFQKQFAEKKAEQRGSLSPYA